MTPAQIAAKVGAKRGAEILAYENDEDELLVSVLWEERLNKATLVTFAIGLLIFSIIGSYRLLRLQVNQSRVATGFKAIDLI